MIKSEHTKDMNANAIKALQKKVSAMNETELEAFRESFEPDMMGFYGEEAIDESEN